jgi:hypothetical protein
MTALPTLIERPRFYQAAFILFAFLGWMLFFGSLFYPVQSNQERPLSEKPVWHINLKVPGNSNETFIEAIKKFAESNGFAIRISSVGV